jgi:hypothetical protein
MNDQAATTILVLVCAFLSFVSAVWALIDVSVDSGRDSSGARLKKHARSLLGLLVAAAAAGLTSAIVGAAF